MTDESGPKPDEPLVTVEDGEGAQMTGMIDVDGEYYPGDRGCYARIKESHTFRAREDDVWIVGYPKCGAHWTYDIIKMVMAGSSENVSSCKDNHFYEVVPFKTMAALPSPRVIDTHLPPKRMPSDVLQKKCKIIFNIRNPKDVAVSYYNHVLSCVCYEYEGTFNGFLKMFLEGRAEYNSWFDNTLGWYDYSKTHPEVLVLKYEDMIHDLFGAVKAVAKHLDQPISDELCKQIAHECDFSVMKERKKATEVKEWFKEEDASFYRKGKVGDWKTWFTVSQNEEFEKVFKEKMKGSDLKVEFEL